jgi:hypothetical protein
MADYETTEQLTRMLALERMKKLSDMYLEALQSYDTATARMYNDERVALAKEFLKIVVK